MARKLRELVALGIALGVLALGSPAIAQKQGGILKLYIEEWLEVDAIVAAGFDRELVTRVLRMVDTNEFKRRQAAPTLRVSNKAFGSGRQMPIAQRWRRE